MSNLITDMEQDQESFASKSTNIQQLASKCQEMLDLDDWAKVFVVGIVIAVIVAALASVPQYFVDKATCEARTAHIGFDHKFGIWSGCLIEVENGQWIPLDNYYFKQD